jgi:hypothetical protein
MRFVRIAGREPGESKAAYGQRQLAHSLQLLPGRHRRIQLSLHSSSVDGCIVEPNAAHHDVNIGFSRPCRPSFSSGRLRGHLLPVDQHEHVSLRLSLDFENHKLATVREHIIC